MQTVRAGADRKNFPPQHECEGLQINTWMPNMPSMARKKTNKDENLVLWPANMSVPMVATGLEEISGEEVEINRENIYSLISKKKGKNGLGGTSRSHLPQGSLC